MGLVRRWQQARAAAVIAECGTGKTLISLGAIHTHAAEGQAFTALAMAPDTSQGDKWCRETLLTLPRVRVFVIDGLRKGTSDHGLTTASMTSEAPQRAHCARGVTHESDRIAPAQELFIRSQALGCRSVHVLRCSSSDGIGRSWILLAARLSGRALWPLSGSVVNPDTGAPVYVGEPTGYSLGLPEGESQRNVGPRRRTESSPASGLQPAVAGRWTEDSPLGSPGVHRSLSDRLLRLRHR